MYKGQPMKKKTSDIVIFNPPRLMAFWSYDKPPYFLGGPITRMYPDGSVETQNYGKGKGFKPIKIIPLAQGRRLLQRLSDAEVQHRTEENKFRKSWVQCFNNLFHGKGES